jgi:hypothetical protein
LRSKSAKSANIIKQFFEKKSIWVPRNAKLDADLEFLNKIAKNPSVEKLSRKSGKKLRALLCEKVFGL